MQSYRTYKFPWIGLPRTPPKIAVSDDGQELYMSWNGATEVAEWVVQGSKKSSGKSLTMHTVFKSLSLYDNIRDTLDLCLISTKRPSN